MGEKKVEFPAEILSAMAHPARLEILAYLEKGETSVGAIVAHVAMNQSAVSQRLGKTAKTSRCLDA